jgi:hypothetical protein
VAVPHLNTVQFSKNSPIEKHRKMENCHGFRLVDTAIHHYVFILQSSCRILSVHLSIRIDHDLLKGITVDKCVGYSQFA